MRAFLATMLSVIAVGVLLIAYGLLAPRASAAGSLVVYDPQSGVSQLVQPGFANDRVAAQGGNVVPYGYQAMPVRYNTPTATPVVYTRPPGYGQAPVRTSRTARAQSSVTRVDRPAGRDWKKTALVIGGSTATGAGIGGLIGGKKGALIGAALGGGASTLWETQH